MRSFGLGKEAGPDSFLAFCFPLKGTQRFPFFTEWRTSSQLGFGLGLGLELGLGLGLRLELDSRLGLALG